MSLDRKRIQKDDKETGINKNKHDFMLLCVMLLSSWLGYLKYRMRTNF